MPRPSLSPSLARGLFRSLATRTAILFFGLFMLSSLTIFLLLYLVATHDLTAQIREAVEQDVRALATITEDQGEAELIKDITALAGSVEAERSLYLLQTADGRVLAGNGQRTDPFEGWRETSITWRSKYPDRFLIYGRQLGDKWLFVGRRVHNVWEIQEAILKAFGWGLLATVPIALAGMYFLARRAAIRVEAIAGAMDAYLQGDLTRRVPMTTRGDEIDHLAGKINHVLRQVERLIAGMKQVTSDVAHDLRTPLSRLRQRLEADRDPAGGDDEVKAEAIAEIDGILATFDALLQIAEIDAGAKNTSFARVDLSELTQFLYETYAGVAEDAGQKLEAAIAAPAVLVEGNKRLLTQLLVNVIENAIRHSPPGTRITLTVFSRDRRACVEIADSGPGIPAAECERVFERFYRLDSSRTTPGNGLGLALVKSIAELHGAAVTLADNNPGLLVQMRFPPALAAD